MDENPYKAPGEDELPETSADEGIDETNDDLPSLTTAIIVIVATAVVYGLMIFFSRGH